jgi:hypothetical protein
MFHALSFSYTLEVVKTQKVIHEQLKSSDVKPTAAAPKEQKKQPASSSLSPTSHHHHQQQQQQ